MSCENWVGMHTLRWRWLVCSLSGAVKAQSLSEQASTNEYVRMKDAQVCANRVAPAVARPYLKESVDAWPLDKKQKKLKAHK